MLYSLLVLWGISLIAVPSPVLGQCGTRTNCLSGLRTTASRPPSDFQETVLYGRCLTLCAHQVNLHKCFRNTATYLPPSLPTGAWKRQLGKRIVVIALCVVATNCNRHCSVLTHPHTFVHCTYLITCLHFTVHGFWTVDNPQR